MSDASQGGRERGDVQERLDRAILRLDEVERERDVLLQRISALSREAHHGEQRGRGTRPWTPIPEEAPSDTECSTEAADVLDGLPGVFYLFGADGRLQTWNRNLEELTGRDARELAGLHVLDILSPAARPAAAKRIREAFATGASYIEAPLRAKDGAETMLFFAGARVFVGGAPYIAGVGLDISARVEEEDRLRRLSNTDELTGLLNRRGFFSRGEEQLQAVRGEGRGVVLLYADLDKLKEINDRRGHAAGDRALVGVARALRETFRDSDAVARLGGDEFAALAIDKDGTLGEATIAERFRSHLDGPAAEITASVGVVSCKPCDAVSMDDLLASADERMYHQKKTSRGRHDAGPRPPAARSVTPSRR